MPGARPAKKENHGIDLAPLNGRLTISCQTGRRIKITRALFGDVAVNRETEEWNIGIGRVSTA